MTWHDDPSWRRIRTDQFEVSVPSNWTEEPEGRHVSTGDAHTLRVDRVLDGLVPVTAIMGQISLRSRQVLDEYEPSPERPMVVPGAGPAATRTTVTIEDGRTFVLAELFAEGLDRHMWYVRVSAERHAFDAVVAERLLDSFQIRFTNSDTPGRSTNDGQ